jgi:hypothetical protein
MKLVLTNELSVTEFTSISGSDLHAAMIKNNLKIITDADEDIFEIKAAFARKVHSLWSGSSTNMGTYAFYFLEEMDRLAVIEYVNQKKV